MGHLTEKEEQRIKDVAIAVGWREPFTTLDGDTIYGTAPGWIGSGVGHIVPDYSFDLNALHEAWVRIIKGDAENEVLFLVHLDFVVSKRGSNFDNTHIVASSRVNATSDERFEALLRTIGKWTE